jgi:hypothetical protein
LTQYRHDVDGEGVFAIGGIDEALDRVVSGVGTPDLSAVENGLPATVLPQGQRVSGPIAVDVPLGKAITQIVLTNWLGGTRLGLWFS